MVSIHFALARPYLFSRENSASLEEEVEHVTLVVLLPVHNEDAEAREGAARVAGYLHSEVVYLSARHAP